MNNNQVKKDNDARKIFTTLVLVLTLMIFTTGATYAYFAITAPTNNSISGTAATAELIITNTTSNNSSAAPEMIAPAITENQDKPMVPQYSFDEFNGSNILDDAYTGAGDKCVDHNGNVICKAYTFVIKNKSTAKLNVKGKIRFNYDGTTNKFTNLRWKLMTDNGETVNVSTKTASATFSDTAPIIAGNDYVNFDTTVVPLAANGGNKQYWLIVWIEETGNDQSSHDKGTFNGEITFDVLDNAGNAVGGITSTITSSS